MTVSFPQRKPAFVEEPSGVVARNLQPAPLVIEYGVRRAVPDDARDMAWIQALSWQVAFEQGLVPRARMGHEFHQDVMRWERRIQAQELPAFVAVRAARVVGFVALTSRGRTARVQSAHVLPVHWLARVPQNLMLAAEDWLTQHSYRELWIQVLTENAAIQHFLVQHGFELSHACMHKGHMHTHYLKRTFT